MGLRGRKLGQGAESLNAAIAAAILMYDLMREYER